MDEHEQDDAIVWLYRAFATALALGAIFMASLLLIYFFRRGGLEWIGKALEKLSQGWPLFSGL